MHTLDHLRRLFFALGLAGDAGVCLHKNQAEKKQKGIDSQSNKKFREILYVI